MMAGIGHNRSPYDVSSEAVDLLETEALNWLDGKDVETQAEADAIGELIRMARKARGDADKARKAEAKPFDDSKKEVQARYKPLIDRADEVSDTCKQALAPFLAAQEAEKRHREQLAREEAETTARAAQEAFQAAGGTSIVERRVAEKLAEKAKQADIKARMAKNDTAKAKGSGRAISTRTTIVPKIDNYRELMRWIYVNDKAALMGFCDTYALGAFRNGQFEMDGVSKDEKVTVA